MRKNSIKNTRVNTEVQRELSNILRGGIKDPRIAPWTSVVSVEVAPDLKTCKAYISVLGDEKAQADTLAGLKSAEGYIRRELAHTLNMRNTPEIRFILDQSIEYGVNMSKKIADVTKGLDQKEMHRMQNRLAELLEGKTSVAIGGHVRPDGDCVGSCMGLYLYLRENFEDIDTDVYLEKIPSHFSFLKGTEMIRHEADAGKKYDLFICLDCGDEERLGFAAPLFESAGHTFCVDHHISNKAFAQDNCIVPDASSTSELVYGLMDREKVTKEIAEALYTGIVHDTGVFRYSCAGPDTFRAAAELLEKGIDAPSIIENTFYEKTYAQNQILGRALLESIVFMHGQCIFSSVSQAVMKFYGVTPKELDGIVSQLRTTRGVEVAVFLYEQEPGVYKVSLRSREKVDVSRVAQYFGGGGHVRAAGCTMPGTVHDVINNLAVQIERQLGADKGEDEA